MDVPGNTALTLMTWNVRYFGHVHGGLRATEGWIRLAARRLARLVPLPDVVALQEVETRSLRGGMAERPQIERFLGYLHEALEEQGVDTRFTGLHYPAHRYALGKGPALYTTGLAMLVRDEVGIEDHNAEAPHDITHVRMGAFQRLKQRRIAAHLRVRRPGAEASVDLVNTHLSLPAFLEVGPHRVPTRMGHGSNQLSEARSVLDFLEQRTGDHTVVVGDFNSAPGSPVYQAFTEGGLVDAHAHHGDAHDDHASARFMHLRMHLDHVFSTPTVEWEQFEAHGIDDEGLFRGLSDHAPKIGRLRATGADSPAPVTP